MGKSNLPKKSNTNDVPDYPYLPEGRVLKFVPLSNKWMKAARKMADTESGCSWWQTGAVIVKNARVIGKGANNKGTFVIPCPRIEQKCKTGEGYDLCEKICKVHGFSHAENEAVKDARSKGNDPKTADVYLFGHWWCCESCWDEMIKAKIRNVYLLQDAHKIFTRESRTEVMNKSMKLPDKSSLSIKDVRWEI